MPRFPKVTPTIEAVRPSQFTTLAARIEAFDGELLPLHIGDTWLSPPPGAAMEDLKSGEHPGLNRYAPVRGLPALVTALAMRVSQRQGIPTLPEHLLVSTGATGGLGAVMGALLAPGDEVLILAPHWPLFAGIVRTFGGVPVAVPFIGEVSSPEQARAVVQAMVTERTVALYVSTPNNPTGRAIPSDQLRALAALARDNDLWLLADEVYEDIVFEGTHTYVRPFAPERCFSVHSFSKGYGMAGNRCGYVVGPTEVMTQVRKVSTHTFYSAPTASQVAALAALGPQGNAWLEDAREQYRELGLHAAERLGVPAPQGSTFLFLDVADHLDERGLEGFLEDCADEGLLLAPGGHFGPYPTHVRVCFTCAEPRLVRKGIEVLARRIGR